MSLVAGGRTACVSIDLDGLGHYAAIHGLGPEVLGRGGADAVARIAPERFCELLGEIGACGTLFAVGDDLLRRRRSAKASDSEEGPMTALAGAAPLARASAMGHEIGNHTLHHRYDLTALPLEKIAREVHGGAKAIAAVIGKRPVGFRAPGYALSAALLSVVHDAGHSYDSSAFPAVPYYLAKAGIMGALWLRGRSSTALLDRPRVLGAPVLPYRPAESEPYARGHSPLWEIPISTVPRSRIPFIGTAVVSLPVPALAVLYRAVRRRSSLNLELHGVDLLDASDGFGSRLAQAQGDLRIPVSRKLDRLRRLLRRIRDDYEIVTLAEFTGRLEHDSPRMV